MLSQTNHTLMNLKFCLHVIKPEIANSTDEMVAQERT